MLSLNDWDSDWTNHYFSGVKNIENSFAYESFILQYFDVYIAVCSVNSELTQGGLETFWLFMNGHLIAKEIVG